jgi:hypothetical protein
MIELPDYLKGGDEARLIPVGASTQKERFACSVLLASLRVVQPFAREFFGHINWRVGSWAKIHGFTEPVFAHQPDGVNCRPDGLLILNTGRRERRAIVETKIGTAKIDTAQLLQYYRLARANGVDAIITVSNELTADPTHLPYELPREIKNIPTLHWSWSSLVMIAELLLQEEEDFDEEQDYILKEIIRYFDHESAGVSCNTAMCAEWADVIERIQEDLRISERDAEVLNVIRCWHQQLESVCISRTRQAKFLVRLSLDRRHWDQRSRLIDDAAELVASHTLSATFEFPRSAGPIELVADARRRNITCRLFIEAPLNRQTYRARVRWLLNQLPDTSAARLDLIWERSQRSSAPLKSFREDVDAGRIDTPSAPRAFEIVFVTDLGSRFAGPRTFIPALEEALASFYEDIAQHIRPWQGRSPAEEDVVTTTDASSETGTDAAQARTIIKKGEISGREFAIFDDGSIEVETVNGIQRFSSFAELTAAAAAKNGHADSHRMSGSESSL